MAKADQYNTKNNKPHWLDILTMVEPESTPLYSTLAKAIKPRNLEFTYFVDKLGAVGIGTIADGVGVTDFTNRAADRAPIVQYVQEQQENWSVSRGQRDDADPAGVTDEVKTQKMKAMLALRIKIERSIGSDQEGKYVDATSGHHMHALGSFLNPENAKIPEFARIQAGSIAQTDTLTEENFRAVLQSVYDACGDAGAGYELHAGSVLQTKVTNFMRMADTGDNFLRVAQVGGASDEIKATVSLYRGDFGFVKIIPNPHLGFGDSDTSPTDKSKSRGYLLNTKYLALNFCKDLYSQDLPDVDGSGSRGIVWAKYSLIHKMPKTSGKFITAAEAA